MKTVASAMQMMKKPYNPPRTNEEEYDEVARQLMTGHGIYEEIGICPAAESHHLYQDRHMGTVPPAFS